MACCWALDFYFWPPSRAPRAQFSRGLRMSRQRPVPAPQPALSEPYRTPTQAEPSPQSRREQRPILSSPPTPLLLSHDQRRARTSRSCRPRGNHSRSLGVTSVLRALGASSGQGPRVLIALTGSTITTRRVSA